MKATQDKLDAALARWEKLAPGVNPHSTDQLAPVFEAHGLPVGKTAEGNPSLTKAALKKIDHPLATLVIAIRRLSAAQARSKQQPQAEEVVGAEPGDEAGAELWGALSARLENYDDRAHVEGVPITDEMLVYVGPSGNNSEETPNIPWVEFKGGRTVNIGHLELNVVSWRDTLFPQRAGDSTT